MTQHFKRESGEGNGMMDAKSVVVSLPVMLGVLVTIFATFGGGTIAAVWWASSISTKMDVLVKQGAEQSIATGLNSTRLTALELWQRQVDTVGSPNMVKRADEMAREIAQLREEFNIHKISSPKL